MTILKDGKYHNQPYSDAKLLTSIRFWIIKKLAGKAVIIMNADIKIQERKDGTSLIKLSDINGFLFTGNILDFPYDIQMALGQANINE